MAPATPENLITEIEAITAAQTPEQLQSLRDKISTLNDANKQNLLDRLNGLKTNIEAERAGTVDAELAKLDTRLQVINILIVHLAPAPTGAPSPAPTGGSAPTTSWLDRVRSTWSSATARVTAAFTGAPAAAPTPPTAPTGAPSPAPTGAPSAPPAAPATPRTVGSTIGEGVDTTLGWVGRRFAKLKDSVTSIVRHETRTWNESTWGQRALRYSGIAAITALLVMGARKLLQKSEGEEKPSWIMRTLKTIGIMAAAGWIVNKLGNAAEASTPAPAVAPPAAPATGIASVPRISNGLNVFNTFAKIDVGGTDVMFAVFNRGITVGNHNYTVKVKDTLTKLITSNPNITAAHWKAGGLEVTGDVLAWTNETSLVPEAKVKSVLRQGKAGASFAVNNGKYTLEFTKI